MVVRNQVKLRIKYGIDQKFLFKTKGTYIVMDKSTPISYWIQIIPFVRV